LKGGAPLARVRSQGIDGNAAWAEFDGRTPVTKAELNFTRDSGSWKSRKWETVAAKVEGARRRVSAGLPAGVTACYLNLVDARGLIVSTAHETMSAAPAPRGW